jgi:hypothetical protein
VRLSWIFLLGSRQSQEFVRKEHKGRRKRQRGPMSEGVFEYGGKASQAKKCEKPSEARKGKKHASSGSTRKKADLLTP